MKETVEPQETVAELLRETALAQVEMVLEQETEVEPQKVTVQVQVKQAQVVQDRRAFHEHS